MYFLHGQDKIIVICKTLYYTVFKKQTEEQKMKRYETKQQENGKFMVIDNESKFKTVDENGNVEQSKGYAFGLSQEQALEIADTKNYHCAWTRGVK
jgi:tellurite resistance-related uncharacterized protein